MKTHYSVNVRVKTPLLKKIHTMKAMLTSRVSMILMGILLTASVMSSTSVMILVAKESEPVVEPEVVDLGYDDEAEMLAQEERTPQAGEDCNLDIVLNEPYLWADLWDDTSHVTEVLEAMEAEAAAKEIPPLRYEATAEEYEILCRVVEAEVEGYEVWKSRGLSHDEIIDAKVRVAQVFLNRVGNRKFGVSTLKGALLQNNATSTIKDGRYYRTTITEYTKEAVNKALLATTPDLTMGAVFFSSGSGGYGSPLFTDKVGHTFSR